jgi:biotin-dependent carboxylase-like uncharacterized protein
VTEPAARVLRVLAVGPSSTVQDRGRPGWLSSGVGHSGAADLDSYGLANRLVANPDGAAAIESVLGGLVVQATAATTVAVTGAPAPVLVDGRPAAHHSVLILRPGQRLALGLASAGLRTYLAVRGGIAVEPVLGSRSTDTLAGIGPAPLAPGDELPIGPAPASWPVLEVAPLPELSGAPVVVRARLGPRDDWFTEPSHLFEGAWVVSSEADRVGARLDRAPGSPALARRDGRELPSEGMPAGAVQVPPSGRPVVFLADHPVTGGYPVVATVLSTDVSALGQARPGQALIFRRG